MIMIIVRPGLFIVKLLMAQYLGSVLVSTSMTAVLVTVRLVKVEQDHLMLT
ncbi:hypothetical protein HQN89_07205 [Paenibacillus frigoriresistens]|nr:hypothetical protein [Paenibacillus frigoriresistens]